MESNRRELLKRSLLASAAAFVAPPLSEARPGNCSNLRTPQQPEGPFYPVVDQVDTDADLIRVPGAQKIADGLIVIVQGIVTDQNCAPVPGALVEIWQACHTGRYNHPSDPNRAPLDPNFQYWGKATTNQQGVYRFRTIVPGAYQADANWMRPPHIHFKVSRLGYMELITQMYFAGHQLNNRDLILQRLPSAEQRKLVVPFKKEASFPHPVGTFNIQIEKI